MTRKRKDVYSSRHIRRLAQQRAEKDFEAAISSNLDLENKATYTPDQNLQVEASCSSKVLVESEVTQSVENVEESNNMDVDKNYVMSNETVRDETFDESNNMNVDKSYVFSNEKVSDVTFNDCNFIEYGGSEILNKCTTEYVDHNVTELLATSLDSGKNVNDDTDSSDSDSYRYSDSDADSIWSNDDVEVDFDIDTVFENLNPSKDERFRADISEWAKNFQIKHNALRALLSILNNYTSTQFCKDPRTLLKTPTSTHLIPMDNGHYCHLGVTNCVEKIVKNILACKKETDTVNLLVNIDGAPITNSSEKGLWVILCKDYHQESVYVIGIYHGTKKPEDPNVFLKMFVEESKALINDGFLYKEKMYNVRIHGFICDAPAKSFVLCTKYHSGYHSCGKCTIEGTYYSSVCFPLPNVLQLKQYCHNNLRTDEDFRSLKYINTYQRGKTILNDLPHVGLVSNVPIDPMHLVYLGIVKQLIKLWVGDKNNHKLYKLTDNEIDIISNRLENLRNILPMEFNRRSRSLRYWKQWKATEFRHFLLYFGPFILKDVLKEHIYKNFLQLHISLVILSNSELASSPENVAYAQEMSILFIDGFQKIYGKKNVTFNIHSFLHVSKDVQKYGPVEMYSAFPFESYICSLKKMIRKGGKPLQQIARRIREYESVRDVKKICINDNKINVEKIHFGGLVPDNCSYDIMYKSLTKNSCCINISDDRNNCVMLQDGFVVNVLNIGKRSNNVYIIGMQLEKVDTLFSLPGIESDVFGIQIVRDSNKIQEWPCDIIQCKMFKIPTKRGFVVHPIIHTFKSFKQGN